VDALPLDLALSVMQDLPLGLWVARIPDGEVCYVNRAFREIMGMGPVTGTGIDRAPEVYRIFDRQGRPFPVEKLPFCRALAARAPVVVEDLVIHRDDGRKVDLRAFANPVFPPGSNAGYITVAFTDISHERQAEERRQATERQLAFAVKHAPIALWMVDAQGIVTLSEGAALAAMGFAPGELIGRSVFELYQASPEMTENNRRVLRGEAVSGVTDMGGHVFLEWSLAPVRSEGGAVSGAIGVATDVTEARLLQQRLHQAQKTEAVGRLAGGIAHDFNNILAAIQGFGWICQQSLPPEQECQADLRQISRACDRGTGLVKQLLAFSSKQVFQVGVVDVAALVGDLEKMLRRVIGADIELQLRTTADAVRVEADAGQLEQVVMNLVLNARDAMAGGGRLTIEVSRATAEQLAAVRHLGVEPGEQVRIAVSDTGVGMDQETQARMFEPFFTTKPKGQGTGLGLASAYGIVQQSRGRIAVTSAPGQGTVVEIFLPLTQARALAPAPRPREPANLQGAETVLVVEDDEMVRELSCQILRRSGYVVLEAANAGEALLINEEHQSDIHLLLSDVVMPRVNGVELAARVKRLRPSIRIAFMSGYAGPPRGAASAEADTLIEKPFAPAILLTRIRELLDRP
jgi:two-component system cell cycle sensor histidine kinase/response regulator CckA